MADNELSAMFPNLASALENWDGQSNVDPSTDGHDDPSHAGVTDEQIEAELRRMGALRAPLSPLVSGQQPPPTPEFYRNGRAVPPGGNASVEPPQEPQEPEPTETIPGVPEAEEEETPATPPPPLTPPEPAAAPTAPIVTPDQVTIGGRTYDRSQVEAWAQFDTLVGADAELRDNIQKHLQKRQGVQPAAQSPLAPVDLPELPQLPPHYEDDETIRGLYNVVQAQRQLLDRTVRETRQALNTASTSAQRTYLDITQGAMSEFKNTKQLDDNTMNAVMKTVVQSGLANTYMRGLDPITGEPTQDPRTGSPDPYKAIMRAMDVAYYMVPETRQAEIDREIKQRVERSRADATRKQKLAGVSGAAGSVPRTQPIPTDANDRYGAMVEEMRQMQNGSWVGDGS
jgi:hypothetical protein